MSVELLGSKTSVGFILLHAFQLNGMKLGKVVKQIKLDILKLLLS